MTTEILELIFQVVVIVLPVLLTWIFTRFGITKEEYQKWQWATERAFEFVQAAKDKFPENSGVQKLAWATKQLKNALIKMGYHLTDEETEALVRAAYQAMKMETIKN